MALTGPVKYAPLYLFPITAAAGPKMQIRTPLFERSLEERRVKQSGIRDGGRRLAPSACRRRQRFFFFLIFLILWPSERLSGSTSPRLLFLRGAVLVYGEVFNVIVWLGLV